MTATATATPPGSTSPTPHLMLPSAISIDQGMSEMWELAKESASEVAAIAATLAAKEAQDISRRPLSRILGELAAHLLSASFDYDELGDRDRGFGRVYEFLGVLERLCTFPVRQPCTSIGPATQASILTGNNAAPPSSHSRFQPRREIPAVSNNKCSGVEGGWGEFKCCRDDIHKPEGLRLQRYFCKIRATQYAAN